MAKSKRELTAMEKLTAGYEDFIEGRKTNKKGKALFEKAIKKVSKPRSAK